MPMPQAKGPHNNVVMKWAQEQRNAAKLASQMQAKKVIAGGKPGKRPSKLLPKSSSGITDGSSRKPGPDDARPDSRMSFTTQAGSDDRSSSSLSKSPRNSLGSPTFQSESNDLEESDSEFLESGGLNKLPAHL